MIDGAPFNSKVSVVCSVGNQPNPTVMAVKAIGEALSQVVLVHGHGRSVKVADTVEHYVRNRFPRTSVTSIGLDNPYTSKAVPEVREKLLPLLGQHRLGQWQLLYGPGTAPMNVAIASLWVNDYPENIWSLGARDLTLTNGRGESLSVPLDSRIPLTEQVELRTGAAVRRDLQADDAPLDEDGRRWLARWLWSSSNLLRGIVVGARPQGSAPGELLERAVRDVFVGLLGTGASVERGVRLEFTRENQRREIDVVVEDVDSGRVTLVSCASTDNVGSKTRTLMRHKANEVRLLAGNLFGSECQSLTVLLAPEPIIGRPIVETLRLDGTVHNTLSERHWVVAAHELFGSDESTVLRTFDEPAIVLERLPDLRRWLIGE